jgi:hypothetical protein
MKELKFVNPNFRGWLIKYIFTGSYFRGYQIYKEEIISKYMEIVLMLSPPEKLQYTNNFGRIH